MAPALSDATRCKVTITWATGTGRDSPGVTTRPLMVLSFCASAGAPRHRSNSNSSMHAAKRAALDRNDNRVRRTACGGRLRRKECGRRLRIELSKILWTKRLEVALELIGRELRVARLVAGGDVAGLGGRAEIR